MADVIRRAIIEVETRQKKSRLDATPASEVGRVFKAETAAATKASEAVNKLTTSYREAGEGALRAARGLALLSASGSEDLRKLVQTVALAQGAFDVLAGGMKAFTHISRVFGPVGTAISGVTAAIGLATLAWQKFEADAEAARKKLEEVREASRKFQLEQVAVANRRAEEEQRQGAERGDLGIRFGVSSVERELASERERFSRLTAEDKRLLSVAHTARRAARLGVPAQRLDVAAGIAFEGSRLYGAEGIPERRLSIVERQEANVRRQLELAEQQKRLQEEQLRETHRSRQEALQGGVASFLGEPNSLVGSLVSKIGDAALERDLKAVNSQFKAFAAEMLNTLQELQVKRRELEDQTRRPK
jgi:hypothetical protein